MHSTHISILDFKQSTSEESNPLSSSRWRADWTAANITIAILLYSRAKIQAPERYKRLKTLSPKFDQLSNQLE